MAVGMQDIITKKLGQALSPARLEIVNESARHAGHAGFDGSGESHFRVLVVSELFEGLGRVDRQRIVYKELNDEMKGGIHALSLVLYTPAEYKSV